jgi:hypothetical protein
LQGREEKEKSRMLNTKIDFAFYLTDTFEYFEICPSGIPYGADKSNRLLQHAFRNLARMFFESKSISLL